MAEVVVITGGAGGIGLATARAFADRGASVGLLDVDAGRAEAAEKEVRGSAGFCVDVSDRAAFAKAVAAIEREFGSVDVLVNNAGVMALAPLSEVSEAAVRRTIEVNLLGAVNGMQLALERMLPRRRGHVINVSSAAAHWPIPGENVYGATKFALDGLAQIARAELRGSAVHVTTVYMGPVTNTELSLGMKERRLVRFSAPEEVAAAITNVAQRPRREVWVPRSLGAAVRAVNLLPWPARLRALQALGVLDIATDVDMEARRSYEHALLCQPVTD